MSKRAYFIGLILSIIGGAAYPQSVLERVLEQVDNSTNLSPVSGVYANIAESVGTPVSVTTTQTEVPPFTVVGNNIITLEDGTYLQFFSDEYPPDVFGGYSTPPTPGYDIYVQTYSSNGTPIGSANLVNETTFHTQHYPDVVRFSDGSFAVVWSQSQYGSSFAIGYQMYNADGTASGGEVLMPTGDDTEETKTYALGDDNRLEVSFFNKFTGQIEVSSIFLVPTIGYTFTEVSVSGGQTTIIDASISNIVSNLMIDIEQSISGTAEATNITIPEINLGDMATTALGAVNTGDITLGVNSSIDEVSAVTTRAISAAMEQVGGSSDVGALVLNVASNASSVNGSIQNSLTMVNTSLGNISTTSLGAVNTGAIASGVNATVMGIVGFSGS